MANVTAREFNQDLASAKRTAQREPVVITDRGRPALVLLSFEEYLRLSRDRGSIVDLLRAEDDIDFEPGRLDLGAKDPEL